MSRKNLLLEQLQLADEIRDKADINIVTCGNCGSVILHRRIPLEQEDHTINCYDCGRDMDESDCPDLFYVGMEIHDDEE